jgi:tRNA U38,U39,U40 pseudouridine synthase TruA
MSVKYAGLQDNPSHSLIVGAAGAAQQMAKAAPSAIKSAARTEAHAYNQWAANGDSSALSSDNVSAANDQLNAWESANCKQ